MNALGRREPSDWVHLDRYPLTADTTPARPTPVVAGTNWYTNFDSPVRKGNQYWIGLDPHNLGQVRGGHCYCLQPHGITDLVGWWEFYDQGNEGACVGFGTSRAMTLINRRRYDANWLYHAAQQIDEWPGTDYEGTSVRAGLDVARTQGLVRVVRGQDQPPDPQEGIAANRWAVSTQDVLNTLGMATKDYVVIRNNWGRQGYPHAVHMPAETVERLRQESGEFGIITDR